MGNTVNKQHMKSDSVSDAWNLLTKTYGLTNQQLAQFESYLKLLITWNQKFNLTALTSPVDIILYHFFDSLAVTTVNFSEIKSLCDVGTGAGFPGIPLKIMYPELALILIEVNGKKRLFLEQVIRDLELQNVIIYAQDWRMFLRSTHYELNYVCARASLQPEEIIRMFRPNSPYKKATFVYWAASTWLPAEKVKEYVNKEVLYKVGSKERKLVFFTIQDA